MPASGPEVIVVGGGVIGTSLTLQLAAKGCQTTLVTPSGGERASTAAGAMLGALGEVTSDLHDSPEHLALRLSAAQRYCRWLELIADLAGRAPRGGSGTLVIAGAHRVTDRRNLEAIHRAATDHGQPAETVDPGDIPFLRPSAGCEPLAALFLPQEGYVDAEDLVDLLAAAASATGHAHVVDDHVVEVMVQASRVIGVNTGSHGLLHAPWTVLCAGAGTQLLLERTPEIGALLPRIVPGKGMGLVLTRSEGDQLTSPAPDHVIRTPNREFACGLHVVPRSGGVYLGATNRVASRLGMSGEATAGEISYLLQGALTEISTDLSRWHVGSWRYGSRPLPVDGRPLAGRTEMEGLAVATATYRNGILLAPLIAEAVATELVDDSPPHAFLSPRGRQGAGPSSVRDTLTAALPDLLALLAHPTEGPMWRPAFNGFLSALLEVAAGSATAPRIQSAISRVITACPITEIIPELLLILPGMTDDAPPTPP